MARRARPNATLVLLGVGALVLYVSSQRRARPNDPRTPARDDAAPTGTLGDVVAGPDTRVPLDGPRYTTDGTPSPTGRFDARGNLPPPPAPGALAAGLRTNAARGVYDLSYLRSIGR